MEEVIPLNLKPCDVDNNFGQLQNNCNLPSKTKTVKKLKWNSNMQRNNCNMQNNLYYDLYTLLALHTNSWIFNNIYIYVFSGL